MMKIFQRNSRSQKKNVQRLTKIRKSLVPVPSRPKFKVRFNKRRMC